MSQKPDVLVILIYAALAVFLSSSCDGPRGTQPGTTPGTPTPARAAPAASPSPHATEPAAPMAEATVVSPDGRWSAYSLALAPVVSPTSPTGEVYRAVLRLTHADGMQWTPVDEWRPYGLGWTWPSVLQWAPDGQALYFTNIPVPDGCALFVNGSDLWRVDLSTGQAAPLAPVLSASIALSPGAETLAYIDGRGAPELVLRDLATGAERRVRVAAEGQQAGDIRWSPDGATLEITVADEPCGNATTYTTVRVDSSAPVPAAALAP